MATGTIQFEKYNEGKPFRTVFYTYTTDIVCTIYNTTTLTHAKMYENEPDLSDTDTVYIRSYEVYVDNVVDDNGGDDEDIIVSRLAKVADENVIDSNMSEYDLKVLTNHILPITDPTTGVVTKYEIDPSDSRFLYPSSLISLLDNQLTNLKAIRVVLVCDVE